MRIERIHVDKKNMFGPHIHAGFVYVARVHVYLLFAISKLLTVIKMVDNSGVNLNTHQSHFQH